MKKFWKESVIGVFAENNKQLLGFAFIDSVNNYLGNDHGFKCKFNTIKVIEQNDDYVKMAATNYMYNGHLFNDYQLNIELIIRKDVYEIVVIITSTDIQKYYYPQKKYKNIANTLNEHFLTYLNIDKIY